MTLSEKTLDNIFQLVFFFKDHPADSMKEREHLLIDVSKTAIQQIMGLLSAVNKLPLHIERLADQKFKCNLDLKTQKNKRGVIGELLTDMISSEVGKFCDFFQNPELGFSKFEA